MTAPSAAQPPLMVALTVAGRRCVVVGSGTAAHDKVRLLLERGADVVVVGSDPVPGIRALADAHAVELRDREFAGGDLDGAFLVINTAPQPRLRARVAAEAEQTRTLINTLDQPDQCSFSSPALVRRGPLQVAVSTSGESPFIAAALRRRLEHEIGEEWGQLTSLTGWVRKRLRRAGAEPALQKRAFRRLLQPDVRAMLRHGEYEDASALAHELAEPFGAAAQGRVCMVGAGPGSPELLTLAARDALASADVVFHDALIDSRVLQCCATSARIVDVGKRAGRPSARVGDIVSGMIAAAREGSSVVRLKGGDPLLFARAAEEMDALAAAGVAVTIVPGVSSATAAPALAGIPLTERGLASSVTVVTAHDRDGRLNGRVDEAARSAETLVVLMPVRHLREVCARVARLKGADTPAALVASASGPEQRVTAGTVALLADVVEAMAPSGPAVLVIGEVARRAAPRDQAHAHL